MLAATWHRSKDDPWPSWQGNGGRGTPPIDIAPEREFYIHHTVTSNHCRTRAEERPHMRDLEQVQRP